MDLREAGKIAVGLAGRLEPEEVGLDLALGRVLARDFIAERDIPGEYRSRWDGFAVSSPDSAGAGPKSPVILNIAPGEVTAGSKAVVAGEGGNCFRIMTGAVLPAQTDAVVPFEDAAVSGERLVLSAPLASGKGVLVPGTDAGKGDVLLDEGDVLTPARLTVAAATGKDRLWVYRRPRVAVLATGDELRDIGESAGGALLFCNNVHLLFHLISVGGGEPVLLGIAPDDPDVIFSRLQSADADLAITTGGMGKGSRDYILEVWKRLGVRIHFDSLNVSPGKGSALGSAEGRIFLGLPGNPWAAQVIYEEIAAPIVRRLQGVRGSGHFTIEARTAEDMSKKKGFYKAFHGSLLMVDKPMFIPNAAGGETGFAGFGRGSAYAVLEPREQYVRQGERVEVKIPDFPLMAWALLGL